MEDNRPQHSVACHCGAVRFLVRLEDAFTTVRRCSCSYCRMRGAISVSAHVTDIDFIQGQENLALYQFHTGTARHFFCKTCGIYTHHQRRSIPDQLGINVACITGVSPFDFSAVPVVDGVVHPSDVGGAPHIIGTLRFDRWQ